MGTADKEEPRGSRRSRARRREADAAHGWWRLDAGTVSPGKLQRAAVVDGWTDGLDAQVVRRWSLGGDLTLVVQAALPVYPTRPEGSTHLDAPRPAPALGVDGCHPVTVGGPAHRPRGWVTELSSTRPQRTTAQHDPLTQHLDIACSFGATPREESGVTELVI